MADKRTIVVGGGYAGVAAAIDLAREGHQTLLVSDQQSFLKLVLLHRTVHTDIAEFCVPFATLAKKFGFAFVCTQLAFDGAALRQYSEQSRIPAIDSDFDFLVVATGARAPDLEKNSDGRSQSAHLLTEEQLRAGLGTGRVARFLKETPEKTITVVGGGPTGLQFLFELSDFFRSRKVSPKLRLLTLDQRLLPVFPERFHELALKKSEERGIEVLTETAFRKQQQGTLLAHSALGELSLESELTILCPGVAPHPILLQADVFGRVRDGHGLLENVFTAGDCSRFDGNGLNSMSAQAAVRKGKAVAANIARALSGRKLERYNYREVGYFLSLGYWDGLGWIGLPGNVLSGLPALAIKEVIEAQFDLFVGGVDTYLNPFRYLPF